MSSLIITKKPRLKKPYLIVAWPGMGEVAYKAASYLIDQLKATEFAQIAPEEFFYSTASAISDGVLDVPALPESKFYYWKNKAGKNDLIIFLSNAQPDLFRADSYAKLIINLAKELKVDSIVSFASMPSAVDHTQSAQIWFAATEQKITDALNKYSFNMLKEGQISGMNGLFLGMAKKSGLKGFCLLGEIPLYTIQIENPKASAVVLDALAKILGIKINLEPLEDQAKQMESEINKLLEYLKLGPPGQSAPIGEEEVELIKKSLGQLTKLPASVKEKIEKLFLESRENIAKATELKAELDKWNVYKEYEDRFLDLFKKNKDKGH